MMTSDGLATGVVRQGSCDRGLCDGLATGVVRQGSLRWSCDRGLCDGLATGVVRQGSCDRGLCAISLATGVLRQGSCDRGLNAATRQKTHTKNLITDCTMNATMMLVNTTASSRLPEMSVRSNHP